MGLKIFLKSNNLCTKIFLKSIFFLQQIQDPNYGEEREDPLFEQRAAAEAERLRISYLNPTYAMISQMMYMEIRESKWIFFIIPLKSYTLALCTEYFRFLFVSVFIVN